MTSSSSHPRKPRSSRRKVPTCDDATLKAAILEAALPHVPFDGFTDKVLEGAAAEAGADKIAMARLFPKGPASLVGAFSEAVDSEMENRLAKAKLSTMKVREKITFAVKTRLAVLQPNKEAARRAAAFLSLPPNAPLALTLLYKTVDSIWRAVGDKSTDFNFYTKRAILAGVYSTTLVRWFNDKTEDGSETDEFLANRIENVMQFEKFKAELREQVKKLPSFAEIFNRPSSRRT